MRRSIVAIAVVIGAGTLGFAPARAELAPTKASQLVTLFPGGACQVTGFEAFTAVDQMQKSDGTMLTFAGPPERNVLVITNVQFGLGLGISAGASVNFILARVASPTSVNFAAQALAVAPVGANIGVATADIQMQRGAPVGPGVALCFCARADDECKSGAIAVVNGFLAPDK